MQRGELLCYMGNSKNKLRRSLFPANNSGTSTLTVSLVKDRYIPGPSTDHFNGDVEDGEKTKKALITHSISFILLIGLFRAAKVLAENSGYGGSGL
ncbi:unnamed protein product [Allacma fusca]|uniref:Uncharacterized protein n=1 Tax=Allacma fusca TaxID=39272 RepID=A0A8J2J4Q6_9HEXA|nr:unnamed protein product [Allacma fusca]